VRPDAVSITRATERLLDAMGVTVQATDSASMVTEHDSTVALLPGCSAGGSTTIDTRGAEAVLTAITRSSSPAAAAG
jgi:hypothetical protein